MERTAPLTADILFLAPNDPLASTRNSMVHPERLSRTFSLMSWGWIDIASPPWSLVR